MPAAVNYQVTTGHDSDAFVWSELVKPGEDYNARVCDVPQRASGAAPSKKRKRGREDKTEKRKHKKHK